MQTPIDSLLRQQAQRGKIRFCMPGHKGMLANNDITEAGAMDNLLHPEGALALQYLSFKTPSMSKKITFIFSAFLPPHFVLSIGLSFQPP